MGPEEKETDKVVEFRSLETSEPKEREGDISDPKVLAVEAQETKKAVGGETKTEIPVASEQSADKSDVSKMPIAKRAAKIRRLTRLGMNGTEICHTLGISYQQYRYAVMWMTQKSWSSNAIAFHRYYVAVQSRLEQIEMDMHAARNGSEEVVKGRVVTYVDHRAIAAFHKIGLDAWNNVFEMALKLGILDREAIKIQTTTVEVGFGDENQVPWFAKKAIDIAAEQVQ